MQSIKQLELIHAFAQKKMQTDQTGHGFDHILRVVNNARYILKHENQPTNELITLSAAYLHDIADDKLVTDPVKADQQLQTFLATIGFSVDQINEILLITDNLAFSKTLGKKQFVLPLAGQIVQDADRLDAIGAIGITRAIYYGGVYHEKIYDPTIPPRTQLSKTAYRDLTQETIINHFYEKLLKLKALMNTATGKQLAEKRQQFMLAFLSEFKAEWQINQQ